MKIAILYKGRSPEAKVSRESGLGINNALIKLGHQTILLDPKECSYHTLIKRIKSFQTELVFIALHGGEGEDGRLQGLLELEKIPFTGSSQKASAIAMDKHLSEILAKSLLVPIAKGTLLKRGQNSPEKNITYPMVIKPNDGGSSMGISIIEAPKALNKALKLAFEYSKTALCQEFIPGKELTVTILGGKSLPVVEIKPKFGFYDYENKYTSGASEYIVPAKLTLAQTKLIQLYALKIHSLFDCGAYSRVDFRFDGKKFYFLEVNTLPGMTPLSLVPMAAKSQGMSFAQLIDAIVKLSC